MKLLITDLNGKQLNIAVANLAKMYNLAGVGSARLVYETTDEFLVSLDDNDEELGGEG